MRFEGGSYVLEEGFYFYSQGASHKGDYGGDSRNPCHSDSGNGGISWRLNDLSYLSGGQVTDRHGTAALLAVVFMSAGMVLGILSFVEKDKFRLFPVLGILLNTLAFGMLSLILYAGAYVDV